MDLLGARLVSRLLLSLLVAHDSLVGAAWRPGLRFRHALLAAVFAALILHTFQIVLSWHRGQILFAIERLEPLQRLSRSVTRSSAAGFQQHPAQTRSPRKRSKVNARSGTQPAGCRFDSRIIDPKQEISSCVPSLHSRLS